MSSQETFTEKQLQCDAEAALGAIAEAGDRAIKLIDAWVAAANAAAVQEVAERGKGKPRKAARRGLNVLKSRKVPIPSRHRKGSLGSAEKTSGQAWLMPPDSTGIRLVALSRGIGAGAVACSMIYLSDEQGVLRVENVETTPNKLKSRLEKLLPGAGYGPVPVPLEWARFKVAQARKAHQKSKAPEPLGFTTAQPLLTPVPEQAPEHPFDSEGFEFAADDARDLAKDSGVLHHMPEFRSWLPPQASVQELLQKTGERFEPGEEPNQEKVSELLKEEMLAATDRYFTPDVRRRLVASMKDAGLSVLSRAGEPEALRVAATIQVVENCGLVTDPPQEVPFLRAFFEKAVSVLMSQGGGKLNIPIASRATSGPSDTTAQPVVNLGTNPSDPSQATNEKAGP